MDSESNEVEELTNLFSCLVDEAKEFKRLRTALIKDVFRVCPTPFSHLHVLVTFSVPDDDVIHKLNEKHFASYVTVTLVNATTFEEVESTPKELTLQELQALLEAKQLIASGVLPERDDELTNKALSVYQSKYL